MKVDKKVVNSFANQLEEVYDPENFKQLGYQLIDVLAASLHASKTQKENVLSEHTPHQLLSEWPLQHGKISSDEMQNVFHKIAASSMHIHHPHYAGHQNAVTVPLAALGQFIAATLNNATGIFQMGPVHSVMEKRVVDWMCEKIGYGSDASGFLTSGGSLANLTALLAARQVMSDNIWENGVKDQANLCILVSDQAHYSARRVMQIMGFGKENIVIVKTNKNFQIAESAQLEEAYFAALEKSLKPIAVVGSATNTGPGTFDDLNVIAEFCQRNNLWFHVDAAHGGTTLLSKKYKELLSGIEKADSVIWDLHKTLLMPGIATAVLFKKAAHSLQAFKHNAPYLAYKAKQQKEIEDCWDENINRTFECTKPPMATGLYLALSCYGEEFFGNYIDYAFDLAKEFSEKLINAGFEILLTPQSNIVNFRYLANQPDLNVLQEDIFYKLNQSGKFFIVKTKFDNKTYLRTSLMNPMTTIQDLEELIVTIKKIAHSET